MILLFQTLRDLWRLLDHRNRWTSGLIVFLLFLSGALEMGSILFLFGYIGSLSGPAEEFSPVSKLFHDLGQGLDGSAYAVVAGLVLIGYFIAKNCFELITSFALMRFAMKRYQHIAVGLFEEFLNIRLDLMHQRGLLQSQQTLDSVAIVFRSSFIPALSALSEVAILATLFVALIFLLEPTLVLFSVAILGTSTAILLFATRRLSFRLGALRVAAEQEVRRSTLEGFRGLIDIRLSGSQRWVRDRYARATSEFAMADRRSRAVNMIPRAQNEILLAGSIVIVAAFFASGDRGLQGALPILAIMGFAGLRITASASRLTEKLQMLRESHDARQKLMQAIREVAPELLSATKISDPERKLLNANARSGFIHTELALKHVSFSYPDSSGPALKDITLNIPRGSFVGICGPSGSGKSTLALVILGLLLPTKGKILCDDWDIFSDLKHWHGQIAFVGQTPFIAPRSIRENVAFGSQAADIDDEQIWNALKNAALESVIRERENGLDAFIGEDGVMLSAGQRQRLSIARALYRNTEVLIFDEATAALDNVTEADVSASIAAMSDSKTVVCIAHRLSTIRNCDQIYYMEDGRILAAGTFSELEQCCPPFRRLALLNEEGSEHE